MKFRLIADVTLEAIDMKSACFNLAMHLTDRKLIDFEPGSTLTIESADGRSYRVICVKKED